MPVATPSEPSADPFLLLIVSSPSGAGKTTLCNRLLAEFPKLRFSVSHTTRKPRASEQNGREYHFVERSTFEQMVAEHAFAEWAPVHGNLYGTSLEGIEQARREGASGVLFDIDHQGARQLRARIPDAVSVFILPPSFAELERRLRSRASDDEETVRRRLAKAREEIEHYALFDYLVENNELELAFAKLRSIVLAEQSRRVRRATLAEQLLAAGSLATQRA